MKSGWSYLADKTLIAPNTRKDLLGNDLVLVVPSDKPQHVDISPGLDLLHCWTDGRLATGDPAHVPAGIYAEQALRKLGIWDSRPTLCRAPPMSGPPCCWWSVARRRPALFTAPTRRYRRRCDSGLSLKAATTRITYPFAVTKAGRHGRGARFPDISGQPRRRATYGPAAALRLSNRGGGPHADHLQRELGIWRPTSSIERRPPGWYQV